MHCTGLALLQIQDEQGRRGYLRSTELGVQQRQATGSNRRADAGTSEVPHTGPASESDLILAFSQGVKQ